MTRLVRLLLTLLVAMLLTRQAQAGPFLATTNVQQLQNCCDNPSCFAVNANLNSTGSHPFIDLHGCVFVTFCFTNLTFNGGSFAAPVFQCADCIPTCTCHSFQTTGCATSCNTLVLCLTCGGFGSGIFVNCNCGTAAGVLSNCCKTDTFSFLSTPFDTGNIQVNTVGNFPRADGTFRISIAPAVAGSPEVTVGNAALPAVLCLLVLGLVADRRTQPAR